MSAATYNFELEQGTSLVKGVVWRDGTGAPVNLTGYTARMQLRETIDSDEILLELSTTNGKITFSPTEGKIFLAFVPSATAGAEWRKAKYDLELTSNSGLVTRLIKGVISLSKEVTRD